METCDTIYLINKFNNKLILKRDEYMERLQKVIASSGYASRRKAEKLILDGKVFVNGEIVKELGTKVKQGDEIVVEGVSLEPAEKEYYLLNKPKGVICSTKDEHNRKTVVELIESNSSIYPVGRLDYDTTGLLILTNDGELANLLMHPNNNVEKKYIANLDKAMAMTDFYKIKSGIMIERVKCLPIRLKIKKNNLEKDYSIIEITIVEGRNHIVKKVFAKLGYNVTKLQRVQYGFLDAKSLIPGHYRKLNNKEVKKLYDYQTKN